ncbi:MAG: hypothetical protein QM644_06140 [Mobilitalea sp.]
MKVTCNHYASKHGVPVILDDFGNPYRYETGVEKALERLQWSHRRAAREVGCETEEAIRALLTLGDPNVRFLNILGAALERQEQEKPKDTE